MLGFYLLIALGPQSPLMTPLHAVRHPHPGLHLHGPGDRLDDLFAAVRRAADPQRLRGDGRRAAGGAPRPCGASPLDAFFTVALPLARPGFLTAAILVFAHTIGEFGVVLMIGGAIPGKTEVLSIELYQLVETLEWGKAHLLAGGVVVFAFAVVLAMLLIERRFGRLQA